MIPLEPGRAAARELARRELLRPEYHRDDPSLVERVLRAVLDGARRVLDAVHAGSPGTAARALVLLVVIVGLVVVLVRRRVGPVARSGRSPALFTGAPRTAAEHRKLADSHAAAGRWADAVRERWRALVRSLEERGVLDPRPGRTVDEAAREAGLVLPGSGAELAAAARAFDEVWYAGVPALADHDAVVRTAEERVR